MKRFNKSLYFLVLVLATFITQLSPAVADSSLPRHCTVFRPAILDKNIVKQSEIDELLESGKKEKGAWMQTTSTNFFWNVFSDRCNNITYESPESGSPQFTVLDFGQELRIAQIVNNYALVYIEPQKGLSYPQISQEAQSMGWVPMDHLLLWTDCPANESFIYKKALIAGNIDNTRNDQRLGNIYFNSSNSDVKTSLMSSMYFFYQMKTDENGMVLLTKESRVRNKKDFYGWANSDTIITVGSIFLEPNWDENVVEKLKGDTIPVINKLTEEVYTQYQINAKKNRVSPYLATQYRLDPEEIRFPIVDYDSFNKAYDILYYTKEKTFDKDSFAQSFIIFEGRVPEKNPEGLDYWRPVIFLAHPEFLKMMEQLKPVIEAAEKNQEDRKPYVEAMKYITKIVGLNNKTKTLKYDSLTDILNEQVVSQIEFQKLVDAFIYKYRKLEEIMERRYPFTFKNNGLPFYWIPVEDLP